MNDDELMTLVREPFAGVRMTMPLDTVAGRGRVLRRRRRLRGLTGAVALAGGLAVALALVPGGQPGAARPRPGTAVLAAWTATRDPDGGFTVAVYRAKDAAGLQAELRDDGLPVRVTFNPQLTTPLPAGCTAPKGSGSANNEVLNRILTPPAILAWQQQQQEQFLLHPPTVHVTYRLNGRVVRTTMLDTSGLLSKLQKEGATDVQVRGGDFFRLPSSLQAVYKKEKADATGRLALYINPAAIPHGLGLYIGVDIVSRSDFNVGEDLVVASRQCTGITTTTAS